MTTAHGATLRKIFTGRAFRRAAGAFVFAALLCCGAARAQTSDASENVLDTARTPAGELVLARRRGDADGAAPILIKLNGKVVAEKGASEEGDAYATAGFYGLYPKGAPRYALVELTVGARICAAKFAVVDLTQKEPARVSRDFGNCAMPRVAYRRDALTITFPAGPRQREPGDYYVGPRQVWSYDRGRLRRVGR